MNLRDLEKRVRAHARDFNSTIFRKTDIVMFVNEGIERFIQELPELADIPPLITDIDEVKYIPKPYLHLLANYATSRLFSQDERHYEATTLMNEFEMKLSDFVSRVNEGRITLVDENGEKLASVENDDYVSDNYFYGTGSIDSDDGVEGV